MVWGSHLLLVSCLLAADRTAKFGLFCRSAYHYILGLEHICIEIVFVLLSLFPLCFYAAKLMWRFSETLARFWILAC